MLLGRLDSLYSYTGIFLTLKINADPVGLTNTVDILQSSF